MARRVYSYEETVENWGKDAKKKIGKWITLCVLGTLGFFGGLAMIIVGAVEEVLPLIFVGIPVFIFLGIPLIVVGVVFLVLFSVKRGVARKKIKKAKDAHDRANPQY